MPDSNHDILHQLRQEILRLQGGRPPSAPTLDPGLGPVAAAFPHEELPTGVLHEFLCQGPAHAAASCGFIAGIAGLLMRKGGACVWIGPGRKIFPPGLRSFGIEPDRIIFVDTPRPKQALWALEEALKYDGLAAVIGEIAEIGLTASRRFQLAVEQSRVTGFLLRNNPKDLNPIACAARWQVSPLQSQAADNRPGLGHPRWSVELLKVRNGQPGKWQVEWTAGRFHTSSREIPALPEQQHRQTG